MKLVLHYGLHLFVLPLGCELPEGGRCGLFISGCPVPNLIPGVQHTGLSEYLLDGWMDGRMNGRTKGRKDGWMDG